MLSLEMARRRAALIAGIRSFFDSRSYLEVDTPALATALIPEPHIEVFGTEHVTPYGDRFPRFLVPSPEVRMKELLVAGFGNIYQLSHCFRNAESVGPQHRPEFTMLEWYTVDADYGDSADLMDELLAHVLSHGTAAATEACRPPALRLSVSEAFQKYGGTAPGVLENLDTLTAAAHTAGLAAEPGESAEASYDDLFQRMFLTLVEPDLPTDQPVILTDYPALLPTLAKQVTGRPFAERWELYAGGIEVANCYTEETDPGRLDSYLQSASRKKLESLVPHPSCNGLHEFNRAPRCSGVALGVDRLLMALTGSAGIQDVIFPTDFCIFRGPNEGRGQ